MVPVIGRGALGYRSMAGALQPDASAQFPWLPTDDGVCQTSGIKFEQNLIKLAVLSLGKGQSH